MELVKIRDDVFLLLQFTPLTIRMVGVDQAYRPRDGDPPLVLPAGRLVTLE